MKKIKDKFLLFLGLIISFVFGPGSVLSQITVLYGVSMPPKEPTTLERIVSVIFSPLVVGVLAIIGAITIIVGLVNIIKKLFKKIR